LNSARSTQHVVMYSLLPEKQRKKPNFERDKFTLQFTSMEFEKSFLEFYYGPRVTRFRVLTIIGFVFWCLGFVQDVFLSENFWMRNFRLIARSIGVLILVCSIVLLFVYPKYKRISEILVACFAMTCIVIS